MKNTIAERVYDFLKNYPPFNMMDHDELYGISTKAQILYFEDNKQIFRAGESVNENFYIVKEGAVGIYNQNSKLLVDKCDEGDIFGLKALLRRGKYSLCSKTLEESIIYSFSSEILEQLKNSNSDARDFIITSFATNGFIHEDHSEEKGALTEKENSFAEIQTVRYSKKLVTCKFGTTIEAAALLMLEKNVGSVIIIKNEKPVGIITNKDFRDKVATGKNGINETVEKVMSSPIITFPENISVAEALIAMIKLSISHLCITKDGTPDSELTGIVSEHDIVLLHGNNPSSLVKQIKRAKNTDELKFVREKAQQLLKGYLEQNIPVFFISKIISEINDIIIKRSIDFSLNEMEKEPPVSFAWLSLGSMGRNEQLLLTDQDNAMVFEDVSYRDLKKTKEYFIKLAKKVTHKLNHIGFEYCPAEMMASNAKWCLSVDEWKQQFSNWITIPSNDKIMLSTIFFDYNLVYGNRQLVEKMTSSIYKSIDKFQIFLNYLGANSVKNPPPLSFFRNFLVEADGEHKNQFDIKARAIMPLVDAARLLILSLNIANCNNTIMRYQRLIKIEPQNKDLYENCIVAFKTLQKFKTEQGIKNNDSGRYVDLKALSKAKRLQLRASFKAIKDIQDLIMIRFQLSQLL